MCKAIQDMQDDAQVQLLCELIQDGTLTEDAAFAKYPRLKNAIMEMLKSHQ